ncbi:MAG: class I SAM-dependent methyltransferase [Candidatus Omnitrophica bacterium]|nr:class I SAM-dependent methyltransferase [Candidatus Omnitrophota bacterium]
MNTLAALVAAHPELREKFRLFFLNEFSGVSKLSFDKYFDDALSPARAEEQFQVLRRKVSGIAPATKLLEIGSGFGTFLLNARRTHGVSVTGIEADGAAYALCRELLYLCGEAEAAVIQGVGEQLPFPDDTFDIVYSSNVLEHVQNPEGCFREALRVLKPGGSLCFVVPNYGSWWDGHYGIVWIPHLPKPLARLYVRLLGRDPRYVDSLQLITLGQILAMSRRQRDVFELQDLGWDIWEYRLRTLDFSGWATLEHLKRLLRVARRMKLTAFCIVLGKALGWLTPVILVGRKKCTVAAA